MVYSHSQPVFRVHTTGPLALLQDQGRPGFSTLGVSPSGSFDRLSAARANFALGNSKNAPVVEILLGGFTAEALAPISLIVTGAAARILISNCHSSRSSYSNTIIDLKQGETISIETAEHGLRSYLAIRGGFDVAEELGSASTDRLSGIGPAPIANNDVLFSSGSWIANPDWLPLLRQIPPVWNRAKQAELTVILGPRDDWFTSESIRHFLTQTYSVSSQSDRIGLRMIPTEVPLQRQKSRQNAELLSEGMVRGSIQVPPNGEPVVFGPDHPVTGGYPVIAVLTRKSSDYAAQLAPGQLVRFRLQPRRPLFSASSHQ